MKPICVFLFLFFQGPWALAQRFAPIEQPIGLAEKIIVRGFRGRLQLVAASNDQVKVEAEKKGKGPLDRWGFQMRKKQNAIEIFIKGPSEQESFEKRRLGTGLPSFDMKITAPIRPIEIFWAQGEVMTSAWNGPLNLQMTSGRFQSKQAEGPLKIQVIEGEVDVAEHQGGIEIQSFKGALKLSKTKGNLQIDNHSGRYTIEDHEGPSQVRNHSGLMTLKNVKGAADVVNVSGTLKVTDYSGSFSGTFTRGALDARFTSLQSVAIQSEDAAITVDAPKESGARVSLKSEKGRLWGPPYLGKVKKGRWTERRGRLKGKEQGNIKIISKYGDIVLK